MLKKIIGLAVVLAAIAGVAPAAQGQAACDRACLRGSGNIASVVLKNHDWAHERLKEIHAADIFVGLRTIRNL